MRGGFGGLGKGFSSDLEGNDVADDDENEEYQPARRRMRVHEPVATPMTNMSEYDDTVWLRY